ncbi:MAG: GTPase RsgA [Bacteroidales bacterium]|nr:GTPase RsgA [Bacteroidales bacterium]
MSETIPVKGQAVVVKHTGSHYLLSRLPEWNLFPAVLRGKVRLKGSTATNPVAVGDVVDYAYEEEMSVIEAVHPRKNYIIRRSANLSRESHIIAANLDHAYLIVTMAYPETKLAFVDRFLVTCEAYGVPVTIVINKRDLYDSELEELSAAFRDIYEAAGYEIL